jgi:hypothetical protein
MKGIIQVAAGSWKIELFKSWKKSNQDNEYFFIHLSDISESLVIDCFAIMS